MEIVKKIASYIWDIPIQKYRSTHNPRLDVVWSKGKKALHSENANYSFGSLHHVFLDACIMLKQEISEAKSVLILGFGAGSILHILEKNYNYSNHVVGVDYDPIIFEIYQKHFARNLKLIPELVSMEAKDYLLKTNKKFDLIFIDIFQDLETDALVYSEELPNLLSNRIENKGTVIINTIITNEIEKNAAFNLVINLGKKFKTVSTLDCQYINRVIFAK